MFRPPFRPVLVVAAVTATALLGACSDDIAAPGPTADATTTTSTAAPTTTTQPSAPTTPEDEVAAAYVAIIDASYTRLQDPNPSDPSIAEQHVGESLTKTLENNRSALANGRRYRFTELGPPRITVRSVDVTGTNEAVILNCIVDDVVVFDQATGAILDDSLDIGEMRSVLVRDAGRWKLSTQTMLEESTEAVSCAR